MRSRRASQTKGTAWAKGHRWKVAGRLCPGACRQHHSQVGSDTVRTEGRSAGIRLGPAAVLSSSQSLQQGSDGGLAVSFRHGWMDQWGKATGWDPTWETLGTETLGWDGAEL